MHFFTNISLPEEIFAIGFEYLVGLENNIFDVYIMLGLGVFVFIVRRLGFHPGPIGLGLILGPIIEPSLIQALYISDAIGVGRVFFTGTINITLIAVSIFSVAFVVWTRRRDQAQERENASVGS